MADHPAVRGIEIGHVHLTVADLDRALAFYAQVLGFELAHRAAPSAAYLTAGGGHHHIVLHAGENGGAAPAPRVRHFSVRYPDRGALAHVLRRLTAAGVAIDQALDLGMSEALWVRDPDGTGIELYYERRPAEWLRMPDGSVRQGAEPLDTESLSAFETPAGGAPTPPGDATPAMSEPMRTRLREMRVRLLHLHKVLLDDARATYELDRGQVGSTASLLQLVIHDPWFAWLHPLSELVVRMDEALQPDAPATDADGMVLLDQVASLLSPAEHGGTFTQRYYEALQRQPAVIVAHAEVRRILKEAR